MRPPVTYDRFVGVLDIAGFECFVVNGYEQLCINLSNEKLQNHFNLDIFQSELSAYKEEGLQTIDVSFQDNKDILDLIEGKEGEFLMINFGFSNLKGFFEEAFSKMNAFFRSGVIAVLDEELFIPRGSDKGFVAKLVKAQGTQRAFAASK